MKPDLILTTLFFLALSAPANAQLNHPLEVVLSSTETSLDTTIMMKPDAGYQDYHIRVRIVAEDVAKDSGDVTIFTQHPFQGGYVNDTLNVIDLDPQRNWYTGDSIILLKFIDINLDGFDDIFVIRGVEEVREIPHYDVWLFDEKTGRFQENDEFSEKLDTDFDLDESTKTISCQWVDFPDPYGYGSCTYRVDGNRLTLLDQITQTRDYENNPDSYIWKHEKLIKGKLKVVKQVTKTQEQLEKEEQ